MRPLTDNPIAMFSRSFEPLPKQPPKLEERRTRYTAKNFDVLWRQLERCSLEADVAWCVAEDETKVDVNEMTVAVEQDVAVMPIFDLQEECDD